MFPVPYFAKSSSYLEPSVTYLTKELCALLWVSRNAVVRNYLSEIVMMLSSELSEYTWIYPKSSHRAQIKKYSMLLVACSTWTVPVKQKWLGHILYVLKAETNPNIWIRNISMVSTTYTEYLACLEYHPIMHFQGHVWNKFSTLAYLNAIKTKERLYQNAQFSITVYAFRS